MGVRPAERPGMKSKAGRTVCETTKTSNHPHPALPERGVPARGAEIGPFAGPVGVAAPARRVEPEVVGPSEFTRHPAWSTIAMNCSAI